MDLCDAGLMGYRTYGVSDLWGVGLMGCRTYGVSDLWGVGLMGCRTYGVSDLLGDPVDRQDYEVSEFTLINIRVYILRLHWYHILSYDSTIHMLITNTCFVLSKGSRQLTRCSDLRL